MCCVMSVILFVRFNVMIGARYRVVGDGADGECVDIMVRFL